jgi:hypothetical protein
VTTKKHGDEPKVSPPYGDKIKVPHLARSRAGRFRPPVPLHDKDGKIIGYRHTNWHLNLTWVVPFAPAKWPGFRSVKAGEPRWAWRAYERLRP